MGWESSGVVRFDLGPLLESQMRTAKVLITCLLLVLEVLVHCLYGGYNLHRFSDALFPPFPIKSSLFKLMLLFSILCQRDLFT